MRAYIVGILMAAGSCGAAMDKADLLLLNGTIYCADEKDTVVEAVAILGDRIVAVGTTQEVRSRYGAAREIDLRGRFACPGFNDAHIHFAAGALSELQVNLFGCKSVDEVRERVSTQIKQLPKGAWVTGRGWDHTLWGGVWPTAADLDAVSPENPVFVRRVDGHVGWANTKAMQLAQITSDTKSPGTGEIVKDESGVPTGVFKEDAMALVSSWIPAPSREERLKALRLQMKRAAECGLTSAQDIGSFEAAPLYRELAASSELTIRISLWQSFEDSVETLIKQRQEFGKNSEWLRLGPVKGFLDGTLGSRTCAMLEPFSDDPHNKGLPQYTSEVLNEKTLQLDKAGFQIGYHAIGDAACRMGLDAFELAQKQNGRKDSRHRIEHAQVVAPSDWARFGELGVIASMQPSHATSDMRWAESRVGEYRILGAYAWHSLAANGAKIAFGTDYPVELMPPLLQLYAAVTRQDADGHPAGGWQPQERVSIKEAIKYYTTGAAYAEFMEKEKGQIASGMLADIVVLSRNLLSCPASEIPKTRVELTIAGGRVVFEHKE